MKQPGGIELEPPHSFTSKEARTLLASWKWREVPPKVPSSSALSPRWLTHEVLATRTYRPSSHDAGSERDDKSAHPIRTEED